MNGKYLVGAVIETIIKVIVIAAVVMFVFRSATAAYDFGYKVFADKPVSVSGGRTITVGIAQDADIKEIAEMLQEKGLIEDAKLFVIQEFLSAYHGDILPGIYDLNTGMTAEEMLEIMSTPTEEPESTDTGSSAAEAAEDGTESGENTETGTEQSEDAGMENTEGMTE